MNKISGLFSRIVGPAAVMAAGTMGAGAVATFILAGAWFRYDLLWVVAAILPLFVIFVDSASRIGLLNTDEGMLSLIRKHIHPSVAWFILLINVPVHLLVGMGQMSVMTAALMSVFTFYPPEAGATPDYVQTYRIAEATLSLLVASGIYWLLSSNGYERMQKAMTALMVVMFFASWWSLYAVFRSCLPFSTALFRRSRIISQYPGRTGCAFQGSRSWPSSGRHWRRPHYWVFRT